MDSALRRKHTLKKYKIEQAAKMAPILMNLSHGCVNQKSQRIAPIAKAGSPLIPGNTKTPSDGVPRRNKGHTPAQQSKSISNTATFDSTASCSKLEQTDKTNATAA